MFLTATALFSLAALVNCIQETAPAPNTAGNVSEVALPSVTSPIAVNTTYATHILKVVTNQTNDLGQNEAHHSPTSTVSTARNVSSTPLTNISGDVHVKKEEVQKLNISQSFGVNGNKSETVISELNNNEINQEHKVINPGQRTSVSSHLHSNLDDLLNADRQRVSRFKRDSNYENLMALLNFLEENGIELNENSEPNVQRTFYRPGNEERSQDETQDYENPHEVEAYNYKPDEFFDNNEDDENVFETDGRNGLQLSESNSLLPGLYRHRQTPLLLPQQIQAGQQRGYLYRNPYHFLAEPRPKRVQLSESRAFGKWGNFMKRKRQSYERNTDKDINRIYSLASMLVDRNSPDLLKDRRVLAKIIAEKRRALAYM